MYGGSPHHVEPQHRPTGSETTPPYAPWSSRFGSELPSVEDDVDVWRFAILALHARNYDDGGYCISLTHLLHLSWVADFGDINIICATTVAPEFLCLVTVIYQV